MLLCLPSLALLTHPYGLTLATPCRPKNTGSMESQPLLPCCQVPHLQYSPDDSTFMKHQGFCDVLKPVCPTSSLATHKTIMSDLTFCKNCSLIPSLCVCVGGVGVGVLQPMCGGQRTMCKSQGWNSVHLAWATITFTCWAILSTSALPLKSLKQLSSFCGLSCKTRLSRLPLCRLWHKTEFTLHKGLHGVLVPKTNRNPKLTTTK